MSSVRIWYVAACEFVLALFLLVIAVLLGFDEHHAVAVFVTSCVLLSVVSVGVGMARRKCWAWYGSWVISILTASMAAYVTVKGSQSDPSGDGGEIIVITVPMLACALYACWVLATSDLNSYATGRE